MQSTLTIFLPLVSVISMEVAKTNASFLTWCRYLQSGPSCCSYNTWLHWYHNLGSFSSFSGRQWHSCQWLGVMSWSRDPIMWSHLSSSNDIPLSPYLLTTLSLLTSYLILLLWNIALMRSPPARITSRFLQPNSNSYQHLLLGLDLSTSETIRESDYLTKPCDWGRHTKQNQPRMMLVRRT